MERRCLPQYRPHPLTATEIAQRREKARLQHAQRLAQNQTASAIGGTYFLTSWNTCIIMMLLTDILEQCVQEEASGEVHTSFLCHMALMVSDGYQIISYAFYFIK